MMSKKIFIYLCLVSILMLTSCFSPTKNIPKTDPYIIEVKEYQYIAPHKRSFKIAKLTNLSSEYELYEDVISRYYLPLFNSWPHADLAEYGVAPILNDYNCKLGYTCIDLNNDGLLELLIGYNDCYNPIILELWAVVNSKPKLIAQASEDSRYYLCHDKEKLLIENETGSVDNIESIIYFSFNGDHMVYLDSIYYPDDSSRMMYNHIIPEYSLYESLEVE